MATKLRQISICFAACFAFVGLALAAPDGPRHYYLQHYTWDDSDSTDAHWTIPDAIGGLDFRNCNQMPYGGSPQGYALTVYTATISDPAVVYLGNDLDALSP